MTRRIRYPDAVRERAVKLVLEQAGEYETQWGAIRSVAEKSGMHPETLRKWVRQAEMDAGHRPGVTSVDQLRIRQLERENKELRRANDILKAAAAFFGAELDRLPKR